MRDGSNNQCSCRYGRRSNWFKIHCLLQEQAAFNGQPATSLRPPITPTLQDGSLPYVASRLRDAMGHEAPLRPPAPPPHDLPAALSTLTAATHLQQVRESEVGTTASATIKKSGMTRAHAGPPRLTMSGPREQLPQLHFQLLPRRAGLLVHLVGAVELEGSDIVNFRRYVDMRSYASKFFRHDGSLHDLH